MVCLLIFLFTQGAAFVCIFSVHYTAPPPLFRALSPILVSSPLGYSYTRKKDNKIHTESGGSRRLFLLAGCTYGTRDKTTIYVDWYAPAISPLVAELGTSLFQIAKSLIAILRTIIFLAN